MLNLHLSGQKGPVKFHATVPLRPPSYVKGHSMVPGARKLEHAMHAHLFRPVWAYFTVMRRHGKTNHVGAHIQQISMVP